jgi:PAS domain S-box-containing protein
MKANTALCFLLTGLALLFSQEREGRPNEFLRRRLARLAAVAVAALALLTLSEYVFGWKLGIDQLLFKDTPGAAQTPFPGRTAPNTALAFLLLGSGLWALDSKWKPARLAAMFLALGGGLIAYVSLLGYAYSEATLYHLGSFTGMALHTALTLFLISLGIVCARPEREPLQVVIQEPVGQRMALLLLAVLLVPAALGWLRLYGQGVGWYGLEMGTALMVASTTLTFLVLIYWTAKSLSQLEAERARGDEKLRDGEERLNLALRSSGVGTWSWNLADNSVAWDEHMGPLVGLPPDTLQLSYETVKGSIHREDREQVMRAHAAAVKGGDEYRNEFRVVWPDGTIRHVASRGRVYRDAQGLAVRMAGAAWDITDRKRAELEILTLNEELEERVQARTAELAATNQELEAFTYSVSHDLRAPLRHISGFSKILAEEYGAGLDPAALRYLERIQTGTRQMGLLVDDLLNLAHVGRQELRRQATGLNSLVDEVLADLKPEAGERQIEWQVGRLPFADCDPALMKQVLVNLLSNAIKFTRPREKAVISVASAATDGETVITVRDNGVGFSMKYADKLFGVFQRLHRPEDFEGTGIGLATVQRILHKHGGRVWAEAELDKGATFYFTLEPTNQKPSQDKLSTGAATHDGTGSRDLVG